jgi:hypothetical protein
LTHIGVELGPIRTGISKFSVNDLWAVGLGPYWTPMVGLRPRRFTCGPRMTLRAARARCSRLAVWQQCDRLASFKVANDRS